ncbi:MAG: TniQ family protein [Rubrivivax sp.]|nr:TniQ family protein [Rubrivivax sp.]
MLPPKQQQFWPVHPQPLPDELFSSWLIRLAHGNGLKVQSFYGGWLGRSVEIWNRDIDRLAPPDLISALSSSTGIPEPTLTSHTCRSFAGIISEDLPVGGHTDWLMPLQVYHRTRNGFGLMFCRACLREDREPYFRRQWRLAFITCCTRHCQVLLDRCSNCQSPVQPHRADMVRRRGLADQVTMTRCARCGQDLRRGALPCSTSATLIDFQRRLEGAMRDGYVDFAGNSNLHSVLFFGGLRAIAKGLLTLRKMAGGAKVTSAGLESLPLQDRTDLLVDLADVIDDWPASFLKRCKSAARPFITFTRDNPTLPYWFYRVCDAELRRDVPRISDEEVAYIEAHIEWLDGRFSLARARAIFGRDLAPALSRSRTAVGQEDAEVLIAGIDHRVAVTHGQERLDHLRDKVVFVTGRVLGLSQRRLAGLRLEDAIEAAADSADERSALVPSTPPELRDYFVWYKNEVRPKYPSADIEPWLFLASGPRGQMSESLIGSRFMRAVRFADMSRRIKNFAHWTFVERTPKQPDSLQGTQQPGGSPTFG